MGGKEDWRPVAELDNLEQTIYMIVMLENVWQN